MIDENMSVPPSKPNKELTTKDILLSLLKDKEIFQIFKEKTLSIVKSAKRKERDMGGSLATTSLIIALITAILAWDSSNSQAIIKKATDDVKEYTGWMQRIDTGIINIREPNQIAVQTYQRGERFDLIKYNDGRLTGLYALVRAGTGSGNILGEDVVQSNILLINFDESVKNIFAPNAPNDWAWRYYLIRSNMLIGLKVKEKEYAVMRARKFIITRLVDDLKRLF